MAKGSGSPDFGSLLRKGAAAPKSKTRLEKLKKALKNELLGLATSKASIAFVTRQMRLLGKSPVPHAACGREAFAATGRKKQKRKRRERQN